MARPTNDDLLRQCWADVIEGWEAALEHLTEGRADPPRRNRARAKRRGWPFWPSIGIAITGEPGAGKTVLARALLSKIQPSASAASLPGRSARSEYHKYVQRTEDRRMRVLLTVIPGQASDARRKAEEAAFGRRPTRAVIHAVCWGRNRTWESDHRLATIRQLRAGGPAVDLEHVFTEYKRRELNNFKRISELLYDAWQDQHDVWLIIAVTMCDLFTDRLDEVRDYFVPTSARAREETARVAYKAASAAADQAAAASSAQPGSGELAHEAARLRTSAERARENLQRAEAANINPARTEFAQALEELFRNVDIRRFRRLAILPVSSVNVKGNFRADGEFGLSGEQESQLSADEIDQLLDHFVVKVGEFCEAADTAREDGAHGH